MRDYLDGVEAEVVAALVEVEHPDGQEHLLAELVHHPDALLPDRYLALHPSCPSSDSMRARSSASFSSTFARVMTACRKRCESTLKCRTDSPNASSAS